MFDAQVTMQQMTLLVSLELKRLQYFLSKQQLNEIKEDKSESLNGHLVAKFESI